MEERLLELEKRLDKAVSTVEKHNFLLESLLVNREQHGEEHMFIRELIREKRLVNQVWERVLTNLISGGALLVVGAVFTAVWIYFKSAVAS